MNAIKQFIRTRAAKAKAQLLQVWLLIPFGNICTIQYGRLQVTFQKNMWVVMSDGSSSDALPLNLVSAELVDALAVEMRRRGYAIAA